MDRETRINATYHWHQCDWVHLERQKSEGLLRFPWQTGIEKEASAGKREKQRWSCESQGEQMLRGKRKLAER